jgi:Ig-like domain from next to BRCA1 gene
MKSKLIAALLFIVLFMNACAPANPAAPTPDVNAIYTSAAYTVVAEFTLTAAAFTPTPFPPTETPTLELPTATATEAFTSNPTLVALGTPAALCDDYSFTLTTLDVTIPDGTTMIANQSFVKTWKIKNTGICTWGTGYSLIYSYGEKMNGKPVPLSANVSPDQEVDVSVNLTAPNKAGKYAGAWQMVNPKGFPFGDKKHILLVNIVVQ